LVKLALRQNDEGYDWLERAYRERDPSLLYFNGVPWTKQYRKDARWESIERKLEFKSNPD